MLLQIPCRTERSVFAVAVHIRAFKLSGVKGI